MEPPKIEEMVGQHVGREVGARSFGAQDETIETGVLVQSQKKKLNVNTSKAPTQTEGRKLSVFRAPRGVSPSGLKGRKPRKDFKESAWNRHVIYGILQSELQV